MSGPKTTHIRANPARLARQVLRHLVPGLQEVEAAARSGEAGEDIAGLSASIEALLGELALFRAPLGERSGAFSIARMGEAALRRCEECLRGRPDASEAADVRSRIEALMQGATRDDVDGMRVRAESLLARWGKAAGVRAEAREALRAVREALKALQGGAAAPIASAKVEDVLRSGLMAAAVSAIDAELCFISACAADAFVLGGLDRSEHTALLDQARRAANVSDLASASVAVGGARQLREAAVQAGNELRERVSQRSAVATRLAGALEDRDFDQVQAYYKEGEAGCDAAPLVLYANSPAGKGHVRVTLGIDGSMVVEVEGVAEGEEEVCLDVLRAFARAAANGGDELVIDDYGRAAQVRQEAQQEHEPQGKKQLEAQVQLERKGRERQGGSVHQASPPPEKLG